MAGFSPILQIDGLILGMGLNDGIEYRDTFSFHAIPQGLPLRLIPAWSLGNRALEIEPWNQALRNLDASHGRKF